MKHRHYIFAALLCMALLPACQGKVDEEFLASDSLCLIEGGKTIFSYDPATCQLSCNPDKCTFRVMTDNMSQWYSIECDSFPASMGQTVSATVKWSGKDSAQNLAGVELRVEKIEGDRIWLWSPRRKLAVSVQAIR